ncbi:hypothetical protein [Edwardsiella tarda]|uniref:Uncharacterized protein n=1 Tax=Edwardsiella tarda ATCC 15947 = NBRC 105688 TaxID=667121 RepID=A0AC61TLI7_EDWTA|nr:hypothetical protein K8O98_10805 [Edwardsiella tarda]UBU95282.1 hypothetical protein AAW15_16590 [Edwardsiella tarda]UCQ01625.1 hypothetical protein DCL27_07700 [Edwardsiella tarda ATCC 15947 = NBRC 105688]
MAVGKTLSVDPQKVNANGSAIALGHPLAPAEHEFGGRRVYARPAGDRTLGQAEDGFRYGNGVPSYLTNKRNSATRIHYRIYPIHAHLHVI